MRGAVAQGWKLLRDLDGDALADIDRPGHGAVTECRPDLITVGTEPFEIGTVARAPMSSVVQCEILASFRLFYRMR